MDVNSATGYLDFATGKVSSFSTWISKAIVWLFTIKNMIFIGIIILIIFAVYYFYKQETLAKRYYFNRKREV